MRRSLPVLIAIVAAWAAAPAQAASPDLVISQVYGGGGNSGATLKSDYIQLFNRGPSAVSVNGWSVQYASAAGTSWQRTDLPDRTVAPGAYLLVKEADGSGGTVDLPSPDVTGTIAMSATAGKVRLVTAADVVRDLVGYGATASQFEGSGPAPGLSNTTAALRKGNGAQDTDDNVADFVAGTPAPSPPPPAVAKAIHEIQGASHLSSLAGAQVATSGIVTARRSNGFYMQDPAPDADDATSEAIFVFTGGAPSVAVGDALKVVGLVVEFRPGGSGGTDNLTTTELTGPSITVESSGNALPAVTRIGAGGRVPPAATIEDDASGSVETSGVFDPASDGIDFYEALEGMRVEIEDAVASGPRRDFGSNREIPVLADGGAGAALRTPRGGILLRESDANPERVILNDVLSGGPTLPAANTGDRFPGTTAGVIDYSFGNFKLVVSSLPARAAVDLPLETTASPGPGQLAVATFNVENLDPSDPPQKFARLASLIADNLRAPDLISVEEVQDNSGAANDGIVNAAQTWEKLIAAISAAGGPAYDYRQIDPVDGEDGGEPGGNIRVGFLFRTDRGLSFVDRPGGNATTAVDIASNPARLTLSPGRIAPSDGAFSNSRKPLAGEFRYDGRTLFAVVNHWNSKGGDDPLFGRFQPPVRGSESQRVAQATLVHDFTADVLAADPNAQLLVLGDLNDFTWSDALETLIGTPPILEDLITRLPEAERYSYVFEGNSQTLDHVLSTPATDVRAVDAVHVNAEYADQASDHDPLVARVCADATAPALGVTASPDRIWPPNHKLVTVTTTPAASDSADPAPEVELVSATGGGPGDVVRVDDTTFRLRADKGNVYTVTYRATDACGNSTTAAATVAVPHDNR